MVSKIAKSQKRLRFGERPRTFRVVDTVYAGKKPPHGYIMSGSVIPSWRRWPEKTAEEKDKAARDARAVADVFEECDDTAAACLCLLHYKYSKCSHHMHTYYNPTAQEARREDDTGDWRDWGPDSGSEAEAELDAALQTIEPDL